MSKLNLKLIRDIRFSPFMFGGIVLLLLIGIALFVASFALYQNLVSSYARSYKMLHLADFDVPVTSAPVEVVNTMWRLPGVQAVEGRVVREVELKQPEQDDRKLTGRIISLPDAGEPTVNQLKLLSGDYPTRDASREILLETSFAKFNNYKLGNKLTVVINDDDYDFRITGIVQSPEYIYVVAGDNPFPAQGTYGVMWMRKSTVDQLFNSSGEVNDISVTMVPGANRRTAMRLAEQILKPYGAEEAIAQEDFVVVELLRIDIDGLRRLAIFFPILFLTISSLSVYNILSRMVHAQRGQIGFMRAVGFSRFTVGVHYLLFSLVIGGTGGLLGSALGHYLGILITRFYTSYIEVPYYDVSLRWGVIIGGFLMAASVTVISGLFPAVAAARLIPAVAIGIEVPEGSRAPVLERFLPFLKRFSLLSRLPFRNFMRNPRRSFSTLAGVASGVTLLLVSSGLQDSTKASVDFYFKYSIAYDIMVSYLTPRPQFALEQIKRWPGVKRVEPVLAVPAKLLTGKGDQTILVYGVTPGSRMLKLTLANGEQAQVAASGLMVTGSTARKLGLNDGSLVRLQLPKQVAPEIPDVPIAPSLPPGLLRLALLGPTFRQQVLSPSRALLETKLDREVHIARVTYQPLGTTAYASIDQIRRWYGSPLELPTNAMNAVVIQADPAYQYSIQKRLYKLDGVSSVTVIQDVRNEIAKAMQQSSVFFNIMLAFSVALAGIIIFNSTLMNVIERTREIATMRTVGLGVWAIVRMILVENLIAYALGIIIGLPFGTWLAGLFVKAYESETFSFQMVIFAATYLITILGILITVFIAQIPAIRYIRGIELAKATKDIG